MPEKFRQLHFNVHLGGGGNHEAAWRHPRTAPVRMTDFGYQQRIAEIAERGKLDAIFYGDAPTLRGNVRFNPQQRLDPIALYGALSVVTSRIGLAATISTTFNEPFNVARKVASIDHLSNGRAAWNIVTTSSEDAARNFGLDQVMAHDQRYLRASEFLDVVLKLWDSWEAGAVIDDRSAGVYVDTDRVHAIHHEGDYFKVQGPLNVPRSPQGRPVLIQAGSSEAGRQFAARYAEVIFTAQRTLPDGQAFYSDLKRRIAQNGRNPEHSRILVGLSPVIGATETEARKLAQELDELTVPEYGLQQVRSMSGVDLSRFPLDGPVPLDAFPDLDAIERHRSRSALILELASREQLTIRQLLQRLAGARGHRTVVGTPEQVAATVVEWFEQRAADGFNFMPAYLPGGLEDFVDQVIPILQRKGAFRTDYEGTTLRDHYGLPHPDRSSLSHAQTA